MFVLWSGLIINPKYGGTKESVQEGIHATLSDWQRYVGWRSPALFALLLASACCIYSDIITGLFGEFVGTLPRDPMRPVNAHFIGIREHFRAYIAWDGLMGPAKRAYLLGLCAGTATAH